ncbi:hypothetical protein [Cellulomonas fimi]|uniref:AMIN-like domain-containing protein n=1 Tax=Cellulomonas fimi TaxID=1708 RepID=A0A7Y0QF38_CELFI|nr:hypothetical protein [Cellulomonas fimi]NMR18661.1 hypothetical protein [Cellulomonas fimi]
MRRRSAVSRRSTTVVVLLSLLAGLSLLIAPSASAHPYCGQVWGSQERSAGDYSSGYLTNIRSGRHACYDRLVLDVDAPLTAWSVRYVDEIVQDGSGFTVPVRGGATLEVIVRVNVAESSPLYSTSTGTIIDPVGYRTFRDVVWAGSFEAVTTVGLGVRARLPFRAFVLPGPGEGSRLVVDVGHRWCASGQRVC